MTITLGWWAIPLVITLVSIAWFVFRAEDYNDSFGVGALMMFVVVVFITMASWLGYFVIREIIGWISGGK